MDDRQSHDVFHRPTMLAWLMVGAISGLFWRELFDLATQVF
jgi:hypothetical protein